MTRRTFTKMTRAFQVVKGVTGKMELKKHDDGMLSPAIPPKTFEIDCGEAGIQLVRVSPGQSINPHKLCKRAGGTYVPALPSADSIGKEPVPIDDDLGVTK